MLTSNVQLGYILTRGGGGGSCPGRFILTPAQNIRKGWGTSCPGQFILPHPPASPPPPAPLRSSERIDNTQILLHHLLQQYLVERDVNFSQSEMLTSNVHLGYVLTRGG